MKLQFARSSENRAFERRRSTSSVQSLSHEPKESLREIRAGVIRNTGFHKWFQRTEKKITPSEELQHVNKQMC